MKTVNRIDWRRGMSIGAKAFIESDNYHIFINKIAQFMAYPSAYGLVPGYEFELECHIGHNQFVIDKVACIFIDSYSRIIQLTQGSTLNLQALSPGVYYVAVSLEQEKHVEIGGLPYLEQIPKYQIMNLFDSTEQPLFPLAKIEYSEGRWQVCDFIPPCCAVCSHHMFIELARQCKQRLGELLTLVEKQERSGAVDQLAFLYIELTDAVRNETAVDFITRLKKIVFALKTCHLVEDANVALWEKMKAFVWKEYNQNLIFETIQEALSYMVESIRFLTQEVRPPAPVKENVPPPQEEELTYNL